MENVLLYTRSGHKVLGSLLGSKPYDAVALAAAVALYLCPIAFILFFFFIIFFQRAIRKPEVQHTSTLRKKLEKEI